MSARSRVLKFTLHPGVNAIHTANRPQFLAVGWQGDKLVVWAEAAVGDAIETRVVAVMTGEAPPDGAEYIGTAISPIVAHVYREAAG